MKFSSNLVGALFMLAASASLILAQGSPITTVGITLCKDWNGTGDDCWSFNSYIYETSFVDTGNVVASNSATQINTALVSGVSALQVHTSNVGCTFGNLVLSTNPTVVCGGYTVTVTAASGQYNLGQNNSTDNALNDNVLCFYCFSQS